MKRKKNEVYEESQITTIYIYFIIFCSKTQFEKKFLYLYTSKFYLQFLCVAGYLKHSNDTKNLNIHKYTSYNMIEIYINKLSATTQIFIAMDYSIMLSKKYFHFRKRQKHLAKTFFFPPRRSNWIHVLWKYLLNYVFFQFLKDMHKNLNEIGIIQTVSKFTTFVHQ